jgi:hypothetical protein
VKVPARLRSPWANLVCTQAAWFACVVGAAQQWPWLGPVVTVVWCGLWLWLSARRRADLLLLVGSAVVGYALDSMLVLGGFFAFAPAVQLGGPSPLWMVALWALFGTTLRGPMQRLLDKPLLAAVVGAVAGPLAYGGGVRLGAASFGDDEVTSRLAIGAAWAIAMPVLGVLERRTRSSTPPSVDAALRSGG